MIRFKKHIRPEAKKKAKLLIEEYEILDSGGIIHIRIFADAFTQELNAQDIINRDGLSIQDRFGQVRAHPLCSIVRDARSQKMAALKALNLDLEPLRDGPGRPGGGGK